MKLALLLLLPAAASFAEPCKDGPPLVAFDHQGVAGQPTSKLVVATTGAWTNGAKKGCLDKQTLDKVTALVDGAPWTVTQKRITCRVAPQTWIEVDIKGKHVYEEKTCGKDLLDDQSTKALGELHGLLDKL